MNVTKTQIVEAAARVVALAANKKASASENGKAGQSAVAAVREYAILTAAAGNPSVGAADYLIATWKATGAKVGTIKPYVSAFRGYRQALAEGVNILDASPDSDGDAKPMTAPAARVFLLSKDEREEKAILDTVRAEIAQRARACKNLADLTAIRDMLPAVEGKVRNVAPTEPTADSILDSLFTEQSEDEQAEEQEAAVA
jgi:hypothetical protein